MKMKIAGFNISKKMLIVIGIILGIIIISSMISSSNKKKEAERLKLEAQQELERQKQEAANSKGEETEILSRDEQIQKQLVELYGEPPEGFEWSRQGDLIALSDGDMTCEDVVYTFIRSLSILDFSTAQRYSSNSSIVDTYLDYYSESTKDLTDYYDDFLRKQYKYALTTIEINGVLDTAIFADGTEIVTLNISALDLTDKDFWEDNRKEIFETVRVFEETESDSVKVEKYIYDYIYNAYLNGDVAKREYNIEVVVSKDNGGGWLISDDSELDDILSYEKGVDVAAYIQSGFEDWLVDTQRQEEREARKKELEDSKENSVNVEESE